MDTGADPNDPGEARGGTPWQSRLLAYKRAERKNLCMPYIPGPDRSGRNRSGVCCNCVSGQSPKLADWAANWSSSMGAAYAGPLQTVICPRGLPGID